MQFIIDVKNSTNAVISLFYHSFQKEQSTWLADEQDLRNKLIY